MDRIELKADITVNEAGALEGLAWPFGSADRVGDVIEKGAFAAARPPLPMLASHDQTDVVGVWDAVTETADGLQVKGRLLVDDVARAREVRALIHAGALRGLSIGFKSNKSAPRRGGGRTISGLELLEISVVAVPAHPGARITSAKAATAGKDTMTEQGTAPEIEALEQKMGQIGESVKGLEKLADRLDKLEAKANRPHGDAKGGDDKEPSVERKAFANYLRLGNQIGAEDQKALTVSSDTQGGYLAPPEISSEVVRALVEFSPIRSYASVVSITAPSVIYPTRTDLTNAQWVGETQEREASDISFGQTEIEAKELATFVDLSNRLMQDAPAAETEVRMALAEDFGKKEATAFVNGTGGLQPKGFMQHPGIAETLNGHATNLSADALVKLLYAMPAMYRNRGAWAMNGTTLGIVRTMKDGDGRFLWQPAFQAGQPETILGRPVIEMVDLPDVASGTFPIVYADWSAYRIVDRLAMSTLVDPYTQATKGMTRIHATRRVGGGVLQAARFRKLKMATS
ncbi:phage major capsid protein [Frigidibacter oleivorans]|uniref:phage major capsid protein n=1 Tax=Frigidibacter oleivorans TaxID=2487129 RepID=UPI000F8F7B39|nr:phage major capsid protein [Frigidibacter oleivorans]